MENKLQTKISFWKILTIKEILSIFSLLFTLFVISTIIFYIDISNAVMTKLCCMFIYFPNTKGINEIMNFSGMLTGSFPFSHNYILINIILSALIEILSIFFIFRKIRKGIILKTICFFVIFQLLFLSILVVVYLASNILITELLTSRAGSYVAQETSYKASLKEKIISDPSEIHSIINNLKLRPDLSISPYLFNVSSKPEKTVFEAYILPRFISHYPSPKEFREYDKLPYYFVGPNHFVINNPNIFLKEFGIELVRKIISLKYPEYVLKNNPPFIIGTTSQVNEFGFSTDVLAQYETYPSPHITMKEISLNIKDMEIPFRVLVHEYLHYLSLSESSNNSYITPYLDEALTDYFTSKVMGHFQQSIIVVYDKHSYMQIVTYGYPLHIKVIDLLASKIPVSVLEKIYFTEDESLFHEAFGHYFINSNYSDFMVTFNKLNDYYFSNTKNMPNAQTDQTFIPEIRKILGI